MRYDDAVAAVYQAPLPEFVAERKRLAGELKAAGDKAAAARLLKLGRPPISAWAVNQLWWHARAAFDALFETAQQLRDGKLDAMAPHREAIAKLRAHAGKLLTAAEHGATEGTLRKVTQTLSALAAAGGWEPDEPGALAADRDPPGFEAIGISNVAAELEKHAKPEPSKADGKHADAKHADAKHVAKHADAKHADAKHAAKHAKHEPPEDALAARRAAAEARRLAELEEAAARAEAAAEQRRLEAQRARLAAERHRLEAALRTARGDIASRERDVTRLDKELAAARDLVEQARAVVADLEDRLAKLGD